MPGAPYWHGKQRNRRAVLRGMVFGAGGVAAFALACGGNKDDQSSGEASPEQQEAAAKTIAGREDTTSQAVPGGVYQALTTADVTNLDPLSSQSFTANAAGAWMYSRLLKYKVGIVDPATGEVEGDLAQSFEQPDPTTIVFKLHPNAAWDERAPTNKRSVDADDVVFSWNKFAASSVSRKDLANSVDPTAPISSVEATDKNTVTMKLAFPYAPITSMLAYTRYLMIQPQEADGGFDPRNETRGSGPWMLSDYQRSVKFTYKKNSNWFVKDRPFLDGWDIPIVPEYSAGLAQFRAKKVWTFAVRQEDIIATKSDLPELVLLQNEFNRTNWLMYFSLQPDSPFLDERVRRAVSMLIDRDQWIDTFYNVNKFQAEGYPVDVRWNSHVTSGESRYWLDPRTDDIGEGKANFAYNPAEAKKLLQAAGFANGISTDFNFISTGQYGTSFPNHCEVFKGMLEAGGDFKLRQVNPDYQTEYLPKFYFGKGDFTGITVGASTTYPDIDGYLFNYYYTMGSRQKVAFQGQNGDARSDSLIEAQRKELDANKRPGIIKDWQRYMATKFLMVPYPGQSPSYSLGWPWVANRGAIRGYEGESAPSEVYVHYWFDKSKYTG